MHTRSLFWGVVLLLLGGLFLLSNLGILSVNLWAIIGPLLLILFGVWLMLGVFFRRDIKVEHANVPLEGASRARIRVNHGAGRLRMYAGAGAGDLLVGDFGGGLEVSSRRDGDLLDVGLSISQQVWFFPFSWGPGQSLDWSFGMARDVPISLELETGANEARIDLAELMVNELSLKSGASSTDLTLPANAGQTHARISSGAAAIVVRIPQGVAARVHYSGGLASLNIDRQRFPRTDGEYRSPDYDSATNKVDLEIETGVGSVDIR
jgi:hypothetical protein